MEYSYMGIFSEVFNWVLNKIISPVFNFVAGLLNTVLSWLFNTILAPILKDVFWPLIKLALDLIVKLLAGVIYGIFAKLLTFVDYTNKMFDYMIGLQKITYNEEKLTLLELFMMRLPGISKVFWAIGFIGLALAFVFTVYAVAKSTLDFDFENRRPVSKVLGTFFKCLIQLFTVQFFVYFVVKASGVILSSVNAALALMGNDSAKATMGSIIFCASSMNAAIDKNYNVKSVGKGIEVGISDAVRSQFYLRESKYEEIDKVKEFFLLEKFDYVTGFVLALAMILIMSMCLFVFVTRLFDMMLLYVVSPYFAAMMPLDDGQRFGKWREMFIGKAFGGFGTVMVMKLYLQISPIVMGSDVKFETGTSNELDYFAKLIFMVGGAWAVLKAGPMITTLISAEAGSQEASTSMAAVAGTMAAGGAVASAGASAAVFVGGKAISAFRGKVSDSRQKFDATKYKAEDAASKKANASPGASSGSGGTSNAASVAASEAGSSAVSGSVSGATSGSGETSNAASGTGGAQENGGYFAKQDKGKVAASYPLGFKKYQMKDGTTRTGYKFGGSLLGIQRDGKGTKASFLGASLRFGNDGKVKSWGLPCGAAKFKRGTDGKMHTSQVSVLGSKWSANTKTGSMQYTDCKLIGLHREFDDKGEGHLTNLLGAKRELQADGEYHMTSLPGGVFQQSYMMGEDGKLERAGIRAMGVNLMIDERALNQGGQSGGK